MVPPIRTEAATGRASELVVLIRLPIVLGVLRATGSYRGGYLVIILSGSRPGPPQLLTVHEQCLKPVDVDDREGRTFPVIE